MKAIHVVWVEPYGLKEVPVTMILTVADAIKHQKSVAACQGNTYATDEIALSDFIAVHWADLAYLEVPSEDGLQSLEDWEAEQVALSLGPVNANGVRVTSTEINP